MKQKYLFVRASRASLQPAAPGAADNGCGFARGPAGWDFTQIPDSYLHDKGSRAFIGAARGVSMGSPGFPAYLLGIGFKCAGGEVGCGPRGAFLRNQVMGDLEYPPPLLRFPCPEPQEPHAPLGDPGFLSNSRSRTLRANEAGNAPGSAAKPSLPFSGPGCTGQGSRADPVGKGTQSPSAARVPVLCGLPHSGPLRTRPLPRDPAPRPGRRCGGTSAGIGAARAPSPAPARWEPAAPSSADVRPSACLRPRSRSETRSPWT